jgi:hypothetical protein
MLQYHFTKFFGSKPALRYSYISVDGDALTLFGSSPIIPGSGRVNSLFCRDSGTISVVIKSFNGKQGFWA